MNKCWWCHFPEVYAFNVCHSCYRWFYRHSFLDDSDYCTVCNKFITKRTIGGMCKECKTIIKTIGYIPKRLENLETKFEDLKPYLVPYEDKDTALMALSPLFKSNQIKWLEALLERIYDKVTLQAIADQWGTSREYVRQCENKAFAILKETFRVVSVDHAPTERMD